LEVHIAFDLPRSAISSTGTQWAQSGGRHESLQTNPHALHETTLTYRGYDSAHVPTEEAMDEKMSDEFRAALQIHVLRRISEESIASEAEAGGMTREQVIEHLMDVSAQSGLGQYLKAYRAEHGHYPEIFDLSRYTEELRAGVKVKAREMAEMLFERHGENREIPIQHFLPDLEQRVRDFYAQTGEWPVFKRDPFGRGLTMGTKESTNQLPPPEPPPPPPPPVSEEERRTGREDKELRNALRRAYCRRDPALYEMFANRQGITVEEMIEGEIDACVEGGSVRSFQLYRAKHGHYPDHTQLSDAANLFREDWEKTWKADKS